MGYDILKPESGEGYSILEPEGGQFQKVKLTSPQSPLSFPPTQEDNLRLAASQFQMPTGPSPGVQQWSRPPNIQAIQRPVDALMELLTPGSPDFWKGTPGMPTSPTTPLQQTVAGAGGALQRLPGGVVSDPLTLAAVAAGGMGVPAELLGAGFGVYGASQLPGNAQQTYQAFKQGNYPKGGEGLVDTGMDLAMMLGGREAMKEKAVADPNRTVYIPGARTPRTIGPEGMTYQRVLQSIADNPENPLAEKAKQVLGARGSDLTLRNRVFTGEGEAVGEGGAGFTRVNPNMTDNDFLMLHEISHDLDVSSQASPEVRRAMGELFLEAKRKIKGAYGTSTPGEFFAEAVSNPRFQQQLKQARSGDRSLFDKVIDFGLQAVGQSREKGSLLEKVRQNANEIIDTSPKQKGPFKVGETGEAARNPKALDTKRQPLPPPDALATFMQSGIEPEAGEEPRWEFNAPTWLNDQEPKQFKSSETKGVGIPTLKGNQGMSFQSLMKFKDEDATDPLKRAGDSVRQRLEDGGMWRLEEREAFVKSLGLKSGIDRFPDSEGEPRSGRFWMAPNGKVHYTEVHYEKAAELLNEDESQSANYLDNKLISKGYLRSGPIPNSERGIFVEGRPTLKQLSVLKDWATENDKVIEDDRGNVLFDPNKGDLFSGIDPTKVDELKRQGSKLREDAMQVTRRVNFLLRNGERTGLSKEQIGDELISLKQRREKLSGQITEIDAKVEVSRDAEPPLFPTQESGIKGGAQKNLTPEDRRRSEQNNSRAAFLAQNLVPAIRLDDGRVIKAEDGTQITHADVLKANGESVEQYAVNHPGRGFIDNMTGKFLSRGEAAEQTGLMTKTEPGRLHSMDLPRATQKSGIELPEQDKDKFTLTSRRLLRSPERLKFGSKTGEVDGGQLVNRLKNLVPPSEKAFLEDAEIDKAFKAGAKTTIEAVDKWIGENEPKVEVRKFGEGTAKLNPKQREINNLVHELDTKLPEWRSLASNEVPEQYKELYNRQYRLSEELLQQGDDFPADERSHWSSISPKSEGEMKGYTEIAVTRPVDKKVSSYEDFLKRGNHEDTSRMRGIYEKYVETGGHDTEKFPSSHSFPPNTLAFVRGYMEGDTFHVVEVQSDWAQQVREGKKREREELANPNQQGRVPFNKKWLDSMNDPLLRHYETLVLKAAIDHAREMGAKKIAVSDAETAMMTEGHDRYSVQQAQEFARENGGQYRQGQEVVIPQSKGMRLHYDRTLPDILESLTGSKGERVEFGEHKGAYEDSLSKPSVKRNNLIFKNADGTPKTSISARSFDLGKVVEQRAEGKPFTTFGKDRAGTLFSGITPKAVIDILFENEQTKKASALRNAVDNIHNSSRQIANEIREGLDYADTSRPTEKNLLDDRAVHAIEEAVRLGNLTRVAALPEWRTPKGRAALAKARTDFARLHPIALDVIAARTDIRNNASIKGVKKGTLDRLAEPPDTAKLGATELLEHYANKVGEVAAKHDMTHELGQLNMPDNKPMVTQPVRSTRSKAMIAPPGYTMFEFAPDVSMPVHNDAVDLMHRLNDPSQAKRDPKMKAVLEFQGGLKHAALLFDSYHTSKMLRYSYATTGLRAGALGEAMKDIANRVSSPFSPGSVEGWQKVPGYKKGFSVLEYNQRTISEMVRKGKITPEFARYVEDLRPDAEYLQSKGLNVGRISANLYNGFLKQPWRVGGKDVNVFGHFNRWTFEEITRGAMVEAGVFNFRKAVKSGMTREEAAYFTERKMNQIFGNMGKESWIKSDTMRDMSLLLFMAPEWVGSQVKAEFGAVKDLANPLQGKPLGPRVAKVGGLMATYFIANQLLNLAFEGKPTWQNDDPDHKFDAKLPGGYWLSPTTDSMEYSHEINKLREKGKTAGDIAAQVLSGKQSQVMRTLTSGLSGRDYTGTKLVGDERYRVPLENLLPTPLPAAGYFSNVPKQAGRQAYSTLGLKVDPDYRIHEEALEKDQGKPFKSMDITERIMGEYNTYAKIPPERRLAVAEKAEENNARRKADMMGEMSKADQGWLKSRELELPGNAVELRFSEKETKLDREVIVHLSKEETATYRKELLEAYKDVLPILRNTYDDLPKKAQVKLMSELVNAAKDEAQQATIEQIQSVSQNEMDKPKKKKRFSVFNP